jgi:hypothetical protein
MRLSALYLLLPLLAESVTAVPRPKRHGSTYFKRIYGNKRAGAAVATDNDNAGTESFSDASADSASFAPSQSAWASASAASDVSAASAVATETFTGIPVATSTPDLADLMPAKASMTISADDPRLTGNNTVPPEIGDIPDAQVSSLLQATSAFDTFEYTTYVATSTYIAPTSTDVEPTPTSVYNPASTGGAPNAMDELEQMAKSKANEMMGQFLPTLTLEVILEPTQVSLDFDGGNVG